MFLVLGGALRGWESCCTPCFLVLLLSFTKESHYFPVEVKPQCKNYHTVSYYINQAMEISKLQAFTHKI